VAKPLENNERYEFGPFRVDVAEHSVFRENQTIPLTPKAFDVLLVFMRNRSRVVTKEELLRAVWPETFVEEGILAVNVSTLRRALGEASDGRAYIETVPKRGYRFVGHVKESTPTQRQVRRGPWTLGVALAAVAGVSAAWFLVRPHSETRMPIQPVPLTSYPGSEHNPTFSPGGDQVAFSWNGEKEDNFDIYVKSVGASGIPLRLTRDPAPDRLPAWSPDGRYIAFARAGSVYLVPPLGGPDRKLADFNAGHVAWTPDGKSVAVSGWRQGIYLISLESGEKRQITFPPADAMGDLFFAFSPDGGDLVFARFVTSVSADLFLVPVPSDGKRGELKKLRALGASVHGLTWTPDGRDVIYASAPMLSPRWRAPMGLWRLPVKPPSDLPPQRIAGVEEGATEPALSHPTSRGATRLVYSRTEFDTKIWLRNGQSGAPVWLIAST